MEFDANQILVLKKMMDYLSCGIDPTSMIAFPDDTVLNNTVLKDCFCEISEILEYLALNINAHKSLLLKRTTNQKAPFFVLEDEITSIPISSEPITISNLTYIINEKVGHYHMKKLKATEITSWLVQKGHLYIDGSEDGGYYKVATELGRTIGITTVKKKNTNGDDYTTNFYNSTAQKYILSNINDISTTK